MRHDPLYMLWAVHCPSPEVSRELRQALPEQINADATFLDEVRAHPEGQEVCSVQPHRLGDYFASVRILPGRPESTSSFRILFERRPDAGRYWKDLMARILQQVRAAAPETTTTLEYRGDEEPASAPPAP
jgi:hypothetical protein